VEAENQVDNPELERAKRSLERGPVSDLQLTDDDVPPGLELRERMSLSKKVAFLRAFALRGIPLDGIRAAGVSRNLVWHWRQTDGWFDALYEAAVEEAGDRLEAEAHRRAFEGVDEPVVFQGMPTELVDPTTGERRMFTVKKYSDPLMALMLKGHKQEKYRENAKVTHDLGGQSGVLIVPASVDPKSWAEAAATQQAKFAGNSGEEK